METYSDEELVELFKNETQKEFAFNLIVDKYKKRIYWHIQKMVIDHDDTDDLLQNTFIKIWESLSKFRNESLLFTWIYRISTNESLRFLNKKKQLFFLPIKNIEFSLIDKIENSPYFSGTDIEKQLQKAIVSLPEKQRLVFNMKYYDNLKYEEIALIVGTSVGALKASYHIATQKIEKIIKQNSI